MLGTTKDAIIRLRNDASVACLLLQWGGKTGGIDGKRVLDTVAGIGLEISGGTAQPPASDVRPSGQSGCELGG